MFDLNLAHIHRAERERDLVEDLRARRILKTTDEQAADGPTSFRRASVSRGAIGLRTAGR